MKVVINKCYGGFGLSIEAKRRIAELGCPHTKKEPEKEYFKKRLGSLSIKEECRYLEMPREKGNLIIDEHNWGDEGRNCPVLVKVVEELGEKANGQCAKLEVVEIPDDVKFIIEDYDGIEHIAEVHRTWR